MNIVLFVVTKIWEVFNLFKKGSVTLLVILVAFSLLLSACGGNNSNSANDTNTSSTNNAGGKKSENPKKPKELRIMVGVVGGKTPEEHELFEKEVERLSGIKVSMEKGNSEKLMATISSGEKFDILQVSKGDMEILVEQGVLMPITDKIKASNMLSNPNVIPTEEFEMIRNKDGEIYGVFTKFQGGTMPTVRQDWMEKLGLDTPKTLDDFYNVLKAFKEKDPDGNGKDDTYGLSTVALYDIQGFMSAAGVKAGYVIDGNGNRTIPYATEAAVPIYEWFAKLHEEGILDPNFATNDSGKMRDAFLTDRVGMITYWDAWVGMFNNLKKDHATFEAKGIAGAVGPNGDIILRRGDPNVWVIPVNANQPETAIEFMEFWLSDPGLVLGTLGIEGHDYTVKDGKYELTETGTEHNMDHGAPFVYSKTWEHPFGNLPGVTEAQAIIAKYGSLEITTPEWKDAQKIVYDYAVKAMSGKMPAAEAVSKMNEELKAANLID
jgi:putative aldouronate transport system substrate-binding protein